MAEITGIIQEIQTKTVTGGKTAYSIVVGGQAYGAGLYAPKCVVGDYVKFELDDARGYKNVERNSLKVSKNKPPADAVAQAAASAPQKTSTGASFDNRQDTISRQAASNTAIQFMTLLSANDALGLPAATAKGKRLEVMETMLAEYTKEFYENNTGVKWKDIGPSKDPATPEVVADTAEVDAPDDESWT